MKSNAMMATAIIGTLTVYVGWQGLQATNVKAELATLNASRERWNQDNRQQVDQRQQTLALLQQQLQEVRDQLAQVKPTATVATSPAPLPPVREVDFAKQRTAMVEVRKLNADRNVELRFGSFLAPLKLSPAVDTMIRQRIADAFQHWAELGRKAAGGDASAAEMEEIKSLNQPAEMRQIMADYLNLQQMTAFDEYQAQLPARDKAQMATSLLRTLGSDVPGLTEASKAIVTPVLVDAMLGNRATTPEAVINSFQSAEAQLQGKLPDDQMNIVKEFIQKQVKQVSGARPAL